MNREQRIKQLEEKVDEMINNLSKTVAKAVKEELMEQEIDKVIKANEAKESWLKTEMRRLNLTAYGRGVVVDHPFNGVVIDSPLNMGKCLYGEHLNCKLQRLHICPVCSKNPTAFCGGDWVIHPAEPTPIRIDQIINGQLLCDRGENSNVLSMYSAIECKKWEPRKGEKVIGAHKERRLNFIGIYDRKMKDEGRTVHFVGLQRVVGVIPFISMEQYDKIVKGE